MSRLPPALFLALGALAPAGSAQVVKLSAPLAREVRSGSVSDVFLTDDGTRVVYRADLTEAQWELFSRPIDGSAPSVKLNSLLQPQGDVGRNGSVPGTVFHGAGDRVVYVADAFADELFQVFSVPADGSAPAQLLSQAGLGVSPYPAGGTGFNLALGPTGANVFYRTGSLGIGSVHVAPVDGSAPARTLVQGVLVSRFWASPDESQVVLSVAAPSNAEALYVMPSDGSQAPLFLALTHPSTPPFNENVIVSDLRFTPDGSRVVFVEQEGSDGDDTYTLSSVRVDGTQPKVTLDTGEFDGDFRLVPLAGSVRVLHGAGLAWASVRVDGSGYATLTPPGASRRANAEVDGTEVFFCAISASVSSIYRAPVDGSQSASLVCVSDGPTSQLVVASPTQLAFRSSPSIGHSRAFVVSRAGGTPVPLHAPATGTGATSLVPHPDGTRILLFAGLEAGGPIELYVAPLDASTPPLALFTVPEGPTPLTLDLTPDGMRALVSKSSDLYQLPLDGSAAPLKLNESVIGDTVGNVTGFQITRDYSRLVYRADLEADEDFALVSLDMDRVERRLGDGAGSVLPGFAFTSDSSRVVYQALVGDTARLQVAPLAGGPPLVLDQAPMAAAPPFLFDAATTRVVYRRPNASGDLALFAVALDGLSAPVPLHDAFQAGRSVGDFRVGAGFVACIADFDQDQVQELWAVPLEGGSVPARLSPALVAGGDVTEFELDPAGTTAVFLADARVDGRFELYRAPLDGQASAARLSGALPPLGDVMEFAITPDGARVVYRADQVRDTHFDLFSVPLSGFPPHATSGGGRRTRITLLSAVGPDGNVRPDWKLSPDGLQVVYRADPTAAGVVELLRVPVDGSTAPVALSGVLPAAGDVSSFVVAPDQSRIAFLADLRDDDVVEPYSVPFAGGAVVPLDVLPFFSDVRLARIDPSSHDLVFLADRRQASVLELFRVPLDGSRPARMLNLPLASNRDVLDDFVPLRDGTVYRADQQQDEILELYLGF